MDKGGNEMEKCGSSGSPWSTWISVVKPPGWACAVGPSHLAPQVAPGDSCAPVCGDGLVVGGEACDDGNLRGDDGCTGDCRVRRAR